MEDTIAHRLKAFRVSLGLTQDEFGAKCGISQRTYANLESGKTRKVSADYLNQIEAGFPMLSPKWVRQGVGSMLREAQPVPALSVAEEPAAAYTPAAPVAPAADVITAFLGQMAERDANHRKELRRLKNESREDLIAQAKTYDWTIQRMAADFDRERADLKAKIAALELRFGLRVPTVEEQEVIERQEEQAKAKAKETAGNPIGFGKVQPQAVEMFASPGGQYEGDFPRLPAAETDYCPLSIAA